MEFKKYKTISALRMDRAKMVHVPPAPLKTSVKGSFDIGDLIADGSTIYNRLYNVMSSNLDRLEDGYSALTDFYTQSRRYKGTDSVFYLPLKIGEVDVLILKKFNSDEELENSDITPNRFGMIVSLAALKYYADHVQNAKSIKAKAQVANKIAEKITNPFAMAHGMVPIPIPEKEDTKESHEGFTMLLFYLITTIGFDAVAIQKPEAAAAIAMYRAYKDYPVKLGLTKNIPDDVDKVDEVLARCMQGCFTKSFIYNGQKIKLEDAIQEKGFLDLCRKLRDFLIANCRAPTKSRVMRVKKIMGILNQDISQYGSYEDDEDYEDDDDDEKKGPSVPLYDDGAKGGLGKLANYKSSILF